MDKTITKYPESLNTPFFDIRDRYFIETLKHKLFSPRSTLIFLKDK